VVLDPKRILTDQVARELLDRGGRRFEIPPSARLADPGDPGVGLHFGVQIAFQQMNVHAGYLERHSFTPPDANPSTRNLCAKVNATTTGRVMTTQPAMSTVSGDPLRSLS
jgi:hypothetical protein